jgi:phosphopantothenoylcysteine decarboxylase/phosphopantothenate--cysteine ligase
MAHAARFLGTRAPLAGEHVVVTAGATRESIDPVRFISNRSSGKMGVALAAAAWRRGANVTLIAGAMSVRPPEGVRVVNVESTEQMAAAVRTALPTARLLIMAAAPADLRPVANATQKIEKEALPESLKFTHTTDILRETIAVRPEGCVVVGFALETSDARDRAVRKLDTKKLDMIVFNNASEAGAGFAVDTNHVTLILSDGRELELPLLHKDDVSELILDQTEELLNAGR